MAKNLIKNIPSSRFTLYDTSSKNLERFKSEHTDVVIASSPADLASTSDTIITMVRFQLGRLLIVSYLQVNMSEKFISVLVVCLKLSREVVW
jgi:hypothetical protein